MTRLLLLVALPCLFWVQGPDSAPLLTAAGVRRICVRTGAAESWRDRGIVAMPLTEDEVASRERLQVPGIADRPDVASPTRSPWVNTNGSRFIRNPTGKYIYDLPPGTAALAAAESFAYGADALLQVSPDDLPALGTLFAFFDQLPSLQLPPLADVGVVDDGSAEVGEVMNLLVRRNLLFRPEPRPDTSLPLNVTLGSREYPRADAADPNALALEIRRQLTDDQRTLRIFGSEVVIGRLTGDGSRARLHLLDYAGRGIEGLRIRVRGPYTRGESYVPGAGRAALQEVTVADGAIEFSIESIETYLVVDLQ